MRFWGPPISAYFFIPMSWFPPETALILFKIQNVLVFAAAFVVLFLFYANFVGPDDRRWWQFAATFAFLCLIYQPFWTVFRVGGQTTPTVLLLLTVGLVLHTRASFWGSALCVTAATLFKPAMAPIMLFLMAVSGASFFVRATVLLGGVGRGVARAAGLADSCGLSRSRAWRLAGDVRVVLEQFALHPDRQPPHRRRAGRQPRLQPDLRRPSGRDETRGARDGRLPHDRRAAGASRSPSGRRHFEFLMAIVFFLLWSRDALGALPGGVVSIAGLCRRLVTSISAGSALVLVALIFVLSIGQNLILTM